MDRPYPYMCLLLVVGWLAGLLPLTALVVLREGVSWLLCGVVAGAWIVALLGAASLLRDNASASSECRALRSDPPPKNE